MRFFIKFVFLRQSMVDFGEYRFTMVGVFVLLSFAKVQGWIQLYIHKSASKSESAIIPKFPRNGEIPIYLPKNARKLYITLIQNYAWTCGRYMIYGNISSVVSEKSNGRNWVSIKAKRNFLLLIGVEKLLIFCIT